MTSPVSASIPSFHARRGGPGRATSSLPPWQTATGVGRSAQTTATCAGFLDFCRACPRTPAWYPSSGPIVHGRRVTPWSGRCAGGGSRRHQQGDVEGGGSFSSQPGPLLPKPAPAIATCWSSCHGRPPSRAAPASPTLDWELERHSKGLIATTGAWAGWCSRRCLPVTWRVPSGRRRACRTSSGGTISLSSPRRSDRRPAPDQPQLIEIARRLDAPLLAPTTATTPTARTPSPTTHCSE